MRKIKIGTNGEVEIQHFDAGGTVVPQNFDTQMANNPNVLNPATALNPVQNINTIGQNISNPGQGLTNTTQGIGQTLGQTVNGLGGIAQNAGAAFTAMNNYNAALAPTSTSNYADVINNSANNALNGYGQNQNIQGQEQNLANALGQQALGQGPNPAQAALNQSTGQNVANQAALMAGQRGASGNVGLMARQNAMSGSGVQQGAIGQAATLQAQQQLNAQNAQASALNNMANQNTAEQGANNNLFGSASSAQNTQNANAVSNYGMAQGINSQVSQNNANATNKTTGGLMNALGGSLSSMLAKGGVVGKDGKPTLKYAPHIEAMASIYHPQMMADGGSVANVQTPNLNNSAAGGFTGASSGSSGSDSDGDSDASSSGNKSQDVAGGAGDSVSNNKGSIADVGGELLAAGGGSVATVNTPNLDNSGAGGFTGSEGGGSGGGGGGIAGLMALLAKGGKVPGKDKVNHNSYSNDTVPALLSPGEVVIPLDVMNSKDPAQAAAKFVAEHLKKKYGTKQHGDLKEALKKHIAGRKAV